MAWSRFTTAGQFGSSKVATIIRDIEDGYTTWIKLVVKDGTLTAYRNCAPNHYTFTASSTGAMRDAVTSTECMMENELMDILSELDTGKIAGLNVMSLSESDYGTVNGTELDSVSDSQLLTADVPYCDTASARSIAYYTRVSRACISAFCENGGQRADYSLNLWHQIARQFRITFMGAGATRVAFRLRNNTILKISVGTEFAYQSINEIRAWAVIKDGPLRDYYVPLIAWDCENALWEVMPVADMYMPTRNKNFDIRTLQNSIEQFGIRCLDMCSNNVGYLNGSPIVLDYGFEDANQYAIA